MRHRLLRPIDLASVDHCCWTNRYQPARNQGPIGTCTAHALVAVVEGQLGTPGNDSEAFLYGRTKAIDSFPNTDGSSLAFGLEALLRWGVCQEELWPYRTDRDYLLSEPSADAFQDARHLRPDRNTAMLLPPRDTDLLRALLVGGLPVAIAVPIFESLQHSLLFHGRGQFTMRLGEDDPPVGYHALCVVGWFTNAWLTARGFSEQPGGGVFLIRNSWGSEWAQRNPLAESLHFGGGYALTPFKFWESFGMEACTVPIPTQTTSAASRIGAACQKWWSGITGNFTAAASSRLLSGLSQRVK